MKHRSRHSLVMLAGGDGDVRGCLESFLRDAPGFEVLVGDRGMSREDLAACRDFGGAAVPVPDDRSSALNLLVGMATGDCVVQVEPWETLESGTLTSIRDGDRYSFVVVEGNVVSTQTRAWRRRDGVRFTNPVFETHGLTGGECVATVLSTPPDRDRLGALDEWIARSPLLAEPHYYRACVLLGRGRVDEFMSAAERYLFLELSPGSGMAVALTRYYMGLVHLARRDPARAMTNAAACLTANPLMAEFWCLAADVYYHLFRSYDRAAVLYENAVVLGSRRRPGDGWPMEIPKYRDYPARMGASCRELLALRDGTPARR